MGEKGRVAKALQMGGNLKKRLYEINGRNVSRATGKILAPFNGSEDNLCGENADG